MPVWLVRGDLFGANILTGPRASAVLDFGLLSTVGHPGFDTAVTTVIRIA